VNRLETARDVKKRSRTFRNGEQSGTSDGLKRLKNHIDFLKTKELLHKNRILSFESIKLTRDSLTKSFGKFIRKFIHSLNESGSSSAASAWLKPYLVMENSFKSSKILFISDSLVVSKFKVTFYNKKVEEFKLTL